MPVHIAQLVALVIAVYALAGVAFAVVFALRGAGRLDPAARTGSWGFRLVIIPAAAALWPWLLGRWLRSPRQTGGHA